MKCSTKIILTGMAVFLLSAGITAAQVGTDGNLAYSLPDFQAGNSDANKPETFVIRNRLDSGGCWTAYADALYMSRSGGQSSIILEGVNGASRTELLNSNGFNFDWAAGPRVGIVGEDILFGCDVEASYFGIDGWSAGKEIIVPAGGANFAVFGQSPTPTTFAMAFGTDLNFHYVSQLHSAEINVRHPIWERLSVFLGFRNVELHEELAVTRGHTSLVGVNVDNHLYGGQIGMNFAFVNTCRFSIEGVVKAGVFGNNSDLAMSVIDQRRLGDKTTHTAAMGEVGLMAIYQVTCNLAARVGYQAMWLDGVAIASNQIEYVDPATSKPYMGGTLFYHGASAGLEYSF
jgi:hypothetical protein